MTGKDKCKMLREIRRRIAEENDIELITKDCTYQGACRGTCPRCEAELRFLEQKLERRRNLGKAVTVCAIAAGMTVSMAGCVLPDTFSGGGKLEGDVPYETTEPTQVPKAKPSLVPTDDAGAEIDQPLEGDPIEPTPDDLVGLVPNEVELEGDVAYIEDYDGDEAGSDACENCD